MEGSRRGQIVSVERDGPREDRVPPPAPPPAPPPRKRRRWLWPVVLLVVIAAGVGVAFYYRANVAPFESTDDAFIEGHVTYVSPRVAGPVVRLLVRDNLQVKAGDLLLEVDA